ncbi:carboxymuconolactone decarboxylase family protein [Cryobacterium sp. N22]|uniref:carboxymuconolactone decarboxylase family protein n=1 Tax=Cryobacterium sp. N22 TaxID=2048290 RepID=UPI000CE40495|nr:carboxymuconolactone decarboxylase family protein [Cryobacterium sp. N22]
MDVEVIVALDYVGRLRRLAISDSRAMDKIAETGWESTTLSPKTLALTRLAALVAIGASEPSFGDLADAAVGAGATPDEIVDVLIGVKAVVGAPRIVAAAPKVALALGYDLDGTE